MPPETTRFRVRALAVLAAPLACLLLVACGSSSPVRDAAATERAKEQQDELKAADFAKCLREHGVQASASASGGGFSLRISPSGSSKQNMGAAQQACAKYRPEPKRVKLSPQERVKREEEVLAFAKCMREHGVDIHTEVGGGKIALGVHGSPAGSGPNPESPAFQAAQKACSGYLKLKPEGRFPGPPPGAGGGHEGPSPKGSGGGASFGLATGG